jgi:tryptophanyl-tRNA synthetase
MITADCRSGKLLCGDCKSMLIERVNDSFAAHAERKEKVREWAESRIVEALPDGFDPHAVVPGRDGDAPPGP